MREGRTLPPREDLTLPTKAGCQHDWADAVGVDLDESVASGRILVCRLCGIYAVGDDTR